jgi:hypothetical protein
MFEGVKPFVRRSVQSGIPVFIISHKDRICRRDRHEPARRLAGVDDDARFFRRIPRPVARARPEGTRAGKLQRIRELACTLLSTT